MRSRYAEEVVLGLTREQLMDKYAELLAEGRDPAMVARAMDPDMEKVRLAHEKEIKQMEMEMERQSNELRVMELAAEKERLAAEAVQNDLRKAELLLGTTGHGKTGH